MGCRFCFYSIMTPRGVIKVNTSPTDHIPVDQMQYMRFQRQELGAVWRIADRELILRHSGAARSDEPGISRFPFASSMRPGMTAVFQATTVVGRPKQISAIASSGRLMGYF